MSNFSQKFIRRKENIKSKWFLLLYFQEISLRAFKVSDERMYHVVLSSDLMQVNADSRHAIAHWQASMTTSAYTFKDPIMSLFHWERVSKAIVIRWQNQAQKSRKPLLLQYCRTHSEFSYYNLQIIFYDTLSLWQQQQHSIVSPWNISENKESSWLILKLLKN